VAYEIAGLGPEDLDVIELHDAFACEESSIMSTWGYATKENDITSQIRCDCSRREYPGQSQWRALIPVFGLTAVIG